jgi:uncharacterized protein YfkK (UPF0435 family)
VRKKNIDDESSQSNGSLDYVLKDMTSKLRVINGAVMFPGTYPLADKNEIERLN